MASLNNKFTKKKKYVKKENVNKDEPSGRDEIKELSTREKIIKDMVHMVNNGLPLKITYRPIHGQRVEVLHYHEKQLHWSCLVDDLFDEGEELHQSMNSEMKTDEEIFRGFFEIVNNHKYCLECSKYKNYNYFDKEKNICFDCKVKYLSVEENNIISKETEACAICQDNCYKNFDYKLECGHVFHRRCAAQVKEKMSNQVDIAFTVSCPVCRFEWFIKKHDQETEEYENIIKAKDQLSLF